ncbi:MAG: hypothetical protein SVP26_11105 [Chloroflexota bacterium]|nr:hypothetical protein [Chloroflexota bacterium]
MEETCDVCGKPLDDKNYARCRICGRKFHMAWSVDADVENCGCVWFNNQSCGMAFACRSCIDEKPELKELIVDTQEAPPF